jgi:DNA-binding LacI/PurR family transcriptional regulator
MDSRLCVQLEVTEAGNEPAYQATAWPVLGNLPFTAIFAFNDSAIGAIAQLIEHGIHLPQDVSVVGYNDIPSAQTNNPSLTTVRQPLRHGGRPQTRLLASWIRRHAARCLDPRCQTGFCDPKLDQSRRERESSSSEVAVAIAKQ